MTHPSPFYHFSVDDVFDAFVEISDRGSRVVDHELFALLDDLHRRCGTTTDLYLFAEHDVGGKRRRLSDVSGRHRAEYEALRWLRLGPHARDIDTPPHAQSAADVQTTLGDIYSEIARFAGATPRSRWVRLHAFSECYECAPFLREMGVDALLLTDKEAHAYRLPASARDEVRRQGHTRHEGIGFVRSHLRLEHLVRDGATRRDIEERLDAALAQHGFACVFTHEIDLRDARVREAAETCAQHLQRRGVPSR